MITPRRKKKVKNAIVISPYYQGTSFEDIVKNLKSATGKLDKAVYFIGPMRAMSNGLDGELLDDNQYVLGQSALLQDLISYPNLSKLLFIDFFNPGLDLIRYFHQQQNTYCQYGSLLHGGSFLSDDLYSWPWLQGFERAWATLYDTIYAPSSFLAKATPQWVSEKIKVFPWGMDIYNKVANEHIDHKSIDVIFPHRLASDKGIDDLITIITSLPDVSFAITTSQTQSVIKDSPYFSQLSEHRNVQFICAQSSTEHLQTLQKSRLVLSCAKQENFGYAIMKAILAGCIPIAPKRLCYPEFLPQAFLYTNMPQAKNLIRQHLVVTQPKTTPASLESTVEVIDKFSFLPLLQDFFEK